eukprot:CAMPEP_0180048040 /NCGR_PEP_ID=MMETSP0984-20121128/38091_1 /TAXON_ID=483367 /ORGANISM="non described non described, Strain CCMP 2436" /LENGTH=167 /DNA_ID=CAMNT_0021976941 /DNA_START=622 /DNA_END=1122 /DNA_ORIENTATION=+
MAARQAPHLVSSQQPSLAHAATEALRLDWLVGRCLVLMPREGRRGCHAARARASDCRLALVGGVGAPAIAPHIPPRRTRAVVFPVALRIALFSLLALIALILFIALALGRERSLRLSWVVLPHREVISGSLKEVVGLVVGVVMLPKQVVPHTPQLLRGGLSKAAYPS